MCTGAERLVSGGRYRTAQSDASTELRVANGVPRREVSAPWGREGRWGR